MITTGWLLIVMGVGIHGPFSFATEMSSRQECFKLRDELRTEAKNQLNLVSIVCEPKLKRGKLA